MKRALRSRFLLLPLAAAVISAQAGMTVTPARRAGAAGEVRAAMLKPRLVAQLGHAFAVTGASFSSDGKFIITSSGNPNRDSGLILWEASSGGEVKRLAGHEGGVSSAAFSPDGNSVVTVGGDKTLRIWDVAAGRESKRYTPVVPASFAAFTPDGLHVVAGGDSGGTTLFDLARDEARRLTDSVPLAISHDARFMLVGEKVRPALMTTDLARTATDNLCIWNLIEMREKSCLTLPTRGTFTGRAVSSDGRFVLLQGFDDRIVVWDAEQGRESAIVRGVSKGTGSAAFSLDGRYFLTGAREGTVQLWDSTTGREVRRFKAAPHLRYPFMVTSVTFSPDGLRILAGAADGTARVWDLESGDEIRRLRSLSSHVLAVSFSTDGERLTTINEDGRRHVWELRSGREVFVESLTERAVPQPLDAASPDGRLRMKADGADAVLLDSATGREVRRLKGHAGAVISGAFSPDGRLAATGGLDCTTRLWELATGKELVRLISFHDGAWAVAELGGRYDASNGGDVEGLHWVAGDEVIALYQLKQRYYEPGLLAKAAGFNSEPLRGVEDLGGIRLHPSVEVSLPPRGGKTLTITLTDRGGGIGKVRVLVNGKEVAEDASREGVVRRESGRMTLSVDLSGAPVLPGPANYIQVFAWNKEGYLSGRGERVLWEAAAATRELSVRPTPGVPRPAAPGDPPELYAIVAGVSDYSGEGLDLRYAAKDAEDMAAALELGAKRLFGAERVHLNLLSTSGKPGTVQPTKENLRKAFEAARKSKPGDLLVVYLAGHGVALSRGSDLYCYLTRDASAADAAALTDPAVRARAAITSDELVEWVKLIPALKQVMILDTCAAGAAAAGLFGMRDASGDSVRALERLKDRTGFHVLMGSTADAVSYESSEYGQGLLTYSLLQAMRGARLREGEYADVSQLFQYAADRVPDLALDIGGTQRPVIAAPRGESFDIGRLTAEDRALVPLAERKPLVLRPVLINRDEGYDNLKLTDEIRRRLGDMSHAAARGQTGARDIGIYIDAEDMPKALLPSGTYTVEGGNVTVTLNLIRDGVRVAATRVEGVASDRKELIAKIIAGIAAMLDGVK